MAPEHLLPSIFTLIFTKAINSASFKHFFYTKHSHFRTSAFKKTHPALCANLGKDRLDGLLATSKWGIQYEKNNVFAVIFFCNVCNAAFIQPGSA
jgi:hypothetical protein